MRESKPDAKNPTKFGAGVDHRGVSLNSENFCVRNSAADKIKPIDVTTRAEILTASTLKMINRLDEINNKSKKTQGYIVNASFNDVQKKALPSSTVIVSNCKGSDSIGSSGESRRAEVQKVPLSDNSNTKSSPWCTRKVLTSMRGRLDAPNKSTLNSSAGVDVVKADSNAKAEANKPSILKNKLIHSATPIADSQKSKPVSILKRKSLSQDETQSSSPPVTFSPSALKKEKDSKKQGILKKRRSLDENEVLRKRSGSPDANFSDFKSILKNERRSSMEELRRRSHSPDSTILQGILKRKFSKEEETEENLGSGSLIEPQGILKRKSLPQPNCGQQHVKIYDSIVAAAAGGIGEMQISESVRPILKKKSSSEEHSASDVSPAEVPKSILKKKTNADGDETEEKPKKPILKSSKTSSFDLAEDVGKRCQNLTPATFEPEPVKPILKRENSRSKLLDDFESGLVFRRTKPEINDRPHSSSDLDSELSAIFLKRRSLESQPINFSNFDSELFKTKISSLNELFTSDFARNSLPVAEKANNLEKFLKGGEDVGKENKISLSYFSPKNSLDVSKSTNSNSPCFENFNSESTSELSRTKAISKKFSGDSVTWQASEIDDR